MAMNTCFRLRFSVAVIFCGYMAMSPKKKMSLAQVSSGRLNGRWVEEFMRITESSAGDGVPRHIEALTVYFLARVIQRARAFILTKSPDFSEASGDRLMVNMAVPVAHAQEVGVSRSFQRCLNWA